MRAHGEKRLAKGNLCSLCLCTFVNRAEKRMIRMEEEEEDVLKRIDWIEKDLEPLKWFDATWIG